MRIKKYFDFGLIKELGRPFIDISMLWIFMLVIVVLLLSSCSVEQKIQYQLSQSKEHYDKAISLGYKPTLDTIRSINSTGQIPIDYKTNIKLYFNNVVDTILEAYCEDLKTGNTEGSKKSKEKLKEVLNESYKFVEIDSTFRFKDGAVIRIRLAGSELNVTQESVCAKETVFIENKYYQHKEFWITVGIVLFLLIVLYLSRK